MRYVFDISLAVNLIKLHAGEFSSDPKVYYDVVRCYLRWFIYEKIMCATWPMVEERRDLFEYYNGFIAPVASELAFDLNKYFGNHIKSHINENVSFITHDVEIDIWGVDTVYIEFTPRKSSPLDTAMRVLHNGIQNEDGWFSPSLIEKVNSYGKDIGGYY